MKRIEIDKTLKENLIHFFNRLNNTSEFDVNFKYYFIDSINIGRNVTEDERKLKTWIDYRVIEADVNKIIQRNIEEVNNV